MKLFQDELVISTLQERCRIAEERNAALEAKYDALLEKYHALKLQGAQPPTPPPPPPAQLDPVTAAVNRAARGNLELRHAILQQVAHDRLIGQMTDEQIVAKLSRPNRVQDEWFTEGSPPTKKADPIPAKAD